MRVQRRRARAGGLVAAAALTLLSTTALPGTDAAWRSTTQTHGGWSAEGLAPPTDVVVAQSCRATTVPARRAQTSKSGDATATFVLSTPTGVVAGDVMVAGITWYGGGGIPAPAGWWKVREETANPLTQAVFARTVTSTEPASHTWTHEAEHKAGGIVAYSGVDPASLTTAAGSTGLYATQTNGVIVAKSLTTTRPGTVLMGFFGLIGTQQITGDARMSTRYAVTASGGSPNGKVSVLAADEVLAAAGASGDRTAKASGGAQVVGQLVAVEPPLQPHATTSWTPSPSTAATGQLYRRLSDAVLQREVTLPADATSTTDGPLTAGTTYGVEVLATSATARSAPATAAFTARAC